MAPDDAEFLSEGFAEQFEEALEWEWGDDDEVIVPYCDLEDPEICESCQ